MVQTIHAKLVEHTQNFQEQLAQQAQLIVVEWARVTTMEAKLVEKVEKEKEIKQTKCQPVEAT